MSGRPIVSLALLLASTALLATPPGRQAEASLPQGQMTFGAFQVRFATDHTFVLEGLGWPTFKGTWTRDGPRVELKTPGMPDGCDVAGRYDVHVEGAHVSFAVVDDGCEPRRMILDRSTWRPVGERPSFRSATS